VRLEVTGAPHLVRAAIEPGYRLPGWTDTAQDRFHDLLQALDAAFTIEVVLSLRTFDLAPADGAIGKAWLATIPPTHHLELTTSEDRPDVVTIRERTP
jgi:hypothetical protein